MMPMVVASGCSLRIRSSWASTGSLSLVPVTLPSTSLASTGSVMAVNTTGMSLSSAAAKQAVAEGVAMAHMMATLFAEKFWAIWDAMALSKPAFSYLISKSSPSVRPASSRPWMKPSRQLSREACSPYWLMPITGAASAEAVRVRIIIAATSTEISFFMVLSPSICI